MADLAGHIGGPAVKASVQNQSGAHPGAKREKDGVLRAPGGPKPPFGQGTGIGVVLYMGGNAIALLQHLDNRNVIPAV